MTTIWRPDTCKCVLVYDNGVLVDTDIVEVINRSTGLREYNVKCKLHSSSVNLLNDVVLHNQSFNTSIEPDLALKQTERMKG